MTSQYPIKLYLQVGVISHTQGMQYFWPTLIIAKFRDFYFTGFITQTNQNLWGLYLTLVAPLGQPHGVVIGNLLLLCTSETNTFGNQAYCLQTFNF